MNIKVYKSWKEIPEETVKEIYQFDKEKIGGYFFDPFTFHIGVVFANDGRVIGAGVVRVVNEFKIIMNPEFKNITKAKSISKLFDAALSNMQCNEAVVEITQGEEHYEELLIKHFKFFHTYGNVLRLEKEKEVK